MRQDDHRFTAPVPGRVSCRFEDDGTLLSIAFDNGLGNILDRALVRDLSKVMSRASQTPAKVIVLEGLGADFSYGTGIASLRPQDLSELVQSFHNLIRSIVQLSRPLLAVVRGRCLGGGLDVVAFAHRVFVSPDARLGHPGIRVGTCPPVASLALPHRIGEVAAENLIRTGRILCASEAHDLHLADEVAEDPAAAARSYARACLLPLSSCALSFAVFAARHRRHHRLLDDLDALERTDLDELRRARGAFAGTFAPFAQPGQPFDWESKTARAGPWLN